MGIDSVYIPNILLVVDPSAAHGREKRKSYPQNGVGVQQNLSVALHAGVYCVSCESLVSIERIHSPVDHIGLYYCVDQ